MPVTSSKKEDIQIGDKSKTECYMCHHCKMRKPVELMTMCKSKFIDRPLKVIQLHNMLLLNSKVYYNFLIENNSYYVYFNYHGDIKELQSQLFKKNDSIENERCCDKYFCNYCLRTSYRTNPEQQSQPQVNEFISNKDKKEKDKCSSKKLKATINHNSNSIKPHTVTKDWCCPWCLNDCFCTRCVRAEQIFRLTALYVYYHGDLTELNEYLKRSSSILEALQEHLISNLVVVKDGSNVVRQNKVCNKLKGKEKDNKEALSKELTYKETLKTLKNHHNNLNSFKLESDRALLYNFKYMKFLDSRIQERMHELENLKKGCQVKRGRGRPKKLGRDYEKEELCHSLSFLNHKREKETLEEFEKKMSSKELFLFSQLLYRKPNDIVIVPSSISSVQKVSKTIKNLRLKLKNIKKRRGRPPGSKNSTSINQEDN